MRFFLFFFLVPAQNAAPANRLNCHPCLVQGSHQEVMKRTETDPSFLFAPYSIAVYFIE